MHCESLGLIYSSDQNLSLSQFKKGVYTASCDTKKRESYCKKHNIGCIIAGSDNYPDALHSAGLPYLLYYQGNLNLLSQPIIGLVGPRQPSEYALQVMQAFFDSAKRYQLVSVSGFARGIDQKAHQLSLDTQIPTIAVLGGGFQHYLTSADRGFLDEIVKKGGLVLSEFKLGFEPTKWSFPQRNKLIAQLSKLLFLPEAREKSGSLITAEFAYQMKKSVFSVPAPIFAPQSAGVFGKMNEKKIKLITDFDGMLSEYFSLREHEDFTISSIPQNISLNEQQLQILNIFIAVGELGLDELVSKIQMSYQELLQALTFLELSKQLEEIQPGVYRKR